MDDITNGIVIKAKRMAKNSEDIETIIDYVSESLKNKLAHETTIKLKELYPHLDEDKIEKLNKLFKEKLMNPDLRTKLEESSRVIENITEKLSSPEVYSDQAAMKKS